MLTGRGGLDVLHDVTLPVSEPGPGRVRLGVRAVGAGATDITMRRGRYAFAPPYPFVLGYEVIGDVEALGAGVANVRLGERVAALVVHGGYARRSSSTPTRSCPCRPDSTPVKRSRWC